MEESGRDDVLGCRGNHPHLCSAWILDQSGVQRGGKGGEARLIRIPDTGHNAISLNAAGIKYANLLSRVFIVTRFHQTPASQDQLTF